MSTDDLGAAIEAAIGAAIEQTVRDHEGGFVTKWVALARAPAPSRWPTRRSTRPMPDGWDLTALPGRTDQVTVTDLHAPAVGQTQPLCECYLMLQRSIISAQAALIADLERRLAGQPVTQTFIDTVTTKGASWSQDARPPQRTRPTRSA